MTFDFNKVDKVATMEQQQPQISISVQTEDFDQNLQYQQLRVSSAIGAIVTFTGLVREFAPATANTAHSKANFELEHYPGMTEQVLKQIACNACKQWPLDAVTVIHRVGKLSPCAQIVFVGVASAHRQAAFEACHFIIDLLKTQAPFWKKEGDKWVEAKESDQHAATRWLVNNA